MNFLPLADTAIPVKASELNQTAWDLMRLGKGRVVIPLGKSSL